MTKKKNLLAFNYEMGAEDGCDNYYKRHLSRNLAQNYFFLFPSLCKICIYDPNSSKLPIHLREYATSLPRS